MKLSRRLFLHLAAGAVALPAVSRVALAQAYPTRSTTLIVPFAAGGPTDVTARIIGEHMSRTLGQTIIIENVVGAGGTTASTRTMRARPDGYTIQLGQMGTHAAAVAFYPNLAYRPDIDFEAIGLAVEQAVIIYGRKNLPADDLKDFIAYVKRNGDKLNNAHAGVGGISHFTCILLNSMLGIKPAMVPFTGTAPATSALVAGQVDYMCSTVPDVVQQIQGGTIKAYAVSTPSRNPALPNVPTAKEAGLSGFEFSAWYGLFAPKGTPKPMLDKLTDALDKALDDAFTRKRLLDLGCDIPPKEARGQDRFAALVKSEIARWTPIIKAANIKAE